MKKAIGCFAVFLLGFLLFFPATIFAHGGGGGGGGGGSDDGASMNPASPPADDYFGSMGGGVSWEPNPNGPGILGSSVYDGRPANIEKGPYQSGTAIEDAEALLLWGYTAGNYTADDVKEQLAWAVKVGLNISKDAQATLDKINNPPKKTEQVSKPAPVPPPKAMTSKELSDVELIAKIAIAFGKRNTKNKQNNIETTFKDVTDVATEQFLKQKFENFKKKWGF